MIAGTKPRMMSLIARHADRWNSVWYGLPTDDFRTERSNLEQACAAIERDPKEIEVSAGLQISADSGQPNDDEFLYGGVDQIADGLAKWRDEGVDEVICRMEPPSVEPSITGSWKRRASSVSGGCGGVRCKLVELVALRLAEAPSCATASTPITAGACTHGTHQR